MVATLGALGVMQGVERKLHGIRQANHCTNTTSQILDLLSNTFSCSAATDMTVHLFFCEKIELNNNKKKYLKEKKKRLSLFGSSSACFYYHCYPNKQIQREKKKKITKVFLPQRPLL